MSISYEADGSIVLQSDDDSRRTKTLSSDLPREQQEAEIIAFFATDQAAGPPIRSSLS